MGFLIKILIIAVAVYVAAALVPGVIITNIQTTILVALVLALLNTFIKPILVLLTIPITLVTLGLFLLVTNALMIMLADVLVHGFRVDGWWTAFLVSVVVSIISYILGALIRDRK